MAVNRTKVLEAAQKFLAKGQYDKAVSEYQKLVQEDPRDVRTLLKIGDLHTRRNKPKDAIDVYQKVADLYAKQGFFLKAVAVYKQILKLDPAHLDATQKLAKMYEELALTSEALSTYEIVADAYVAQGQMGKALETLDRMVELDAQNVAVRIKQAEALSKAGKAREAAAAFAAGAQLLREQGRLDDYLRVVERQLYHDPENLVVARELASLYLERSDPKRALAKLQICFKADPRDVQTLEMLAEAFRQLGQQPKTISVLKEISRLHAEAGSDEPRRRTLQRVLDLDPNDAEAKQALSLPLAGKTAPEPKAKPPAVVGKPEAPPTAAPPARRAPPPPPAAGREPLESDEPAPRMPAPEPRTDEGEEEELDLEAADELELIEEDGAQETLDDANDEVLIVDEPAPELGMRSSHMPAAPGVETRVVALLADADAREGAGDYEGAVAALQGVLEVEPNHVAAHERLKDIYVAADRRVDAVKELLWLSNSWETHSHDRAVHYAEAAYELAPRSEATRRRLVALGQPLPGETNAKGRNGAKASQEAMDAELDAILPPLSRTPSRPPVAGLRGEAQRSEAHNSEAHSSEAGRPVDLLDLPISPDDFGAAPPRTRKPLVDRELALALLDREIRPSEFAPRAPEARSGDVAERADATRPERAAAPASAEFAPVGTSELSPSDAPLAAGERAASEPPEPPEPPEDEDESEQLLRMYRRPVAAENQQERRPAPAYDRAPLTQPHEYTLDDYGPEPTLPGEPAPELLHSVEAPPAELIASPSVAPESLEPRARSSEPVVSQATSAPVAAQIPADIEEVLDEAEFFAGQGLLEEALELIQEAILIYPQSSELKERLALYEARADRDEAAAESASESGDDESFDIAEQLANELVEVDAPADNDELVDVESVFAQFKKGVAEQIPADDSETHFDLGIAYKEMGLFADAVNEFELAAQSKKRACTALTMVGMCHLEQGNPQLALSYFQRALQSEQRGAGEELALNYEIATVYEQTGELAKATAAYEKVAARDRTFRGVATKLDQLKKRRGKSARGRR